MDDFYKKQPIYACDVALRNRFTSDTFDPNTVTKLLADCHEPLRRFIGKLYPAGTAFVFAKARPNLTIGSREVLGFALTCFHAAYEMDTNEKMNQMSIAFINDSEGKKEFECRPIFEFHTLFPNEEQYSDKTGQQYCFPNDIALLAIFQGAKPGYRRNIEFEEFPIANINEFQSEMEGFISGYPLKPQSNYILPGGDDIKNLDELIDQGFHGFSEQIISEGSIIFTNSGLIEIQASSTTGMSGSPIMCGVWPNSKIVGVYCGGPPLEGQRELVKIIDLVLKENFKSAYESYKKLPFMDQNIYDRFDLENEIAYRNLIALLILTGKGGEVDKESYEHHFPSIKKNLIKEGIKREKLVSFLKKGITDFCVSTLYASVSQYKNTDIMDFNVGVSTNARIFQILREIQIFLKDLVGPIKSVNELENRIRAFCNN